MPDSKASGSSAPIARDFASVNAQSAGNVLKGDMVKLADGQFNASRARILIKMAESLGATITDNDAEATITLTNPSSAQYTAPQTNGKDAKSKNIIVPYHYLSHCQLSNKRISPGDLDPPIPFFTRPDQTSGPLRVWVSVNLHRQSEATPHEAQLAVQNQISRVGGLIVEKRANADLLIVDRNTDFYKTCLKEHLGAGRGSWQRFAERDWVDSCIRKGKLVWPAMEVAQDDQDSMAEEDRPVKGTGPGRPTGKPRVDYSPEDDDFLCRWLAAHNSLGAPGTRKTYEIMTNMSDKYPLANRHTHQSWHERFKKNAAIFTKRVARFKDLGIDDTLKTKQERTKARELKAQREKQKEAAAATAAENQDEVQPPLEIPGTGQTLQPTSTAQKEGARLTELAEKAAEPVVADVIAAREEAPRATQQQNTLTTAPTKQARNPDAKKRPALVEPDSEDEVQKVIQPVEHRARPVMTATASLEKQSDGAKVNEDSSALEKAAEASTDATATATVASVEAQADTSLPVESPVTQSVPAEPPNPSIEAAIDPPIVSEPTNPTAVNGGSITVPLENPVATEVPTIESAQPGNNPLSVPAPVPDDATTTSPVRTITTEDESATIPAQPPATSMSPSAAARSPKKVRIEVAESFGQSVEILAQQSTEPAVPTRDAFQPRHSVPAPVRSTQTPERAVISGTRYSTPNMTTPLKRSLVQEMIATSEQKRIRSTIEGKRRPSTAVTEVEEPDTIMANTKFPTSILETPVDLRPPRPPTPPKVSNEEYILNIHKGKSLVLRQQEEYKSHISRLCSVFGVAPNQLAQAVNDIPRKRKRQGDLYWTDVEAALREKFTAKA